MPKSEPTTTDDVTRVIIAFEKFQARENLRALLDRSRPELEKYTTFRNFGTS